MNKYLYRLLPAFIIIVLCAIFFYPTLLKGMLPVPSDTLIGLYHPWLDQAATTNPSGVPFKNFLITDPIRQQIPWRKLAVDDLKKGMLPLWNPYNFSGTSLLGNIQAGVWYPLNIFFFILPFPIAWTALIIAQPLLAMILLYAYLRHKKLPPEVAIFAGVVWGFCGFSIAWLTWGTIVQTVLWIPLIFLSIDHVIEDVKKQCIIRWSIILVLSLAFTIFAGHAQIAIYIFLFTFVYTLFGLRYTPDRKKILWLVLASLAALAISAVQWFPFLQLFGHSARFTDNTAWLKDGWFLPWQNTIQFIAPDFFGNPATLNYWGIWNYGEFIGYIGILPLLFTFYAIANRNDRLTRFFEIFSILVLLFLLPTPLAKLPFQLHLPVIFSLQPTRLMVLLDFCLISLAALGMDAYLRNPGKRVLIGIIFVGILLGGMWAYVLRMPHLTGDAQSLSEFAVTRRNLLLPTLLWAGSSLLLLLRLRVKTRWTGIYIILVIAVTVFDLFRFGWKFIPFTPPEYFFPSTAAVSFLQSQQKPFRVMSLDNRAFPPNVTSYYGIETPEGYDPVYDARYEEFIAALNRNEPNISPPFGFNRIITLSNIDSPLLPLLNVKYIVTLADLHSPYLELMYREGNTRIYWYKKALPRIYPVESVIRASQRGQVMSLLYSKSFNPVKEAIVEGNPEVPAWPVQYTDTIRITSYTDSAILATSSLAADHVVVVLNMFDPGWHATIDGKITQIYRTNYLFMSLVVPKGEHAIRLTYE